MRFTPILVLLPVLMLPPAGALGGQSPYRPSDPVIAAIGDMGAPVELFLFAAPGAPSHLLVQPYLARLAAVEGVSLQVLDHAREPDLARELGVRDNGWLVVVSGGGREGVRLGATASRVCRIAPVLDDWMLGALDRLSTPPCPVTLVAGEGRATHSLVDLLSRMELPVTRVDPDDPWPESTCLALAAGPLTTDADARLAEHVRGGGHALLLVSADDGSTETLSHLGIGRGEVVLVNPKVHVVVDGTPADGRFLMTNRVATHPAARNVSRHTDKLAVVLPDSVALDPGARATALLHGFGGTCEDRDADLSCGPDEALDSPVLGVVVEGDDGGRVAVLASPSVFDDLLVPVSHGNAFLAVDLVTWLAALPESPGTTHEASPEQFDACYEEAMEGGR